MSLGYCESYFLGWCDTVKVTMQSSELRGRKTNTEGFGKKINDITEDTVICLDMVKKRGV